jgi:hypothetical protein
MRFEVPEQMFEQSKSKIEEYIRQMYKDENGTVYHRL